MTYHPNGPTLGLTSKERDRFSLYNLVRAHLLGDAAALRDFRGVSEATAAQTNAQASGLGGILLPVDSLSRRDLTVANASGGGYLKGTEIDYASALTATSVIDRLPLRRIALQGDLTMGTGVTVSTSWQSSEGASISHADPDFSAAAATPKTVGCVVTASRRLWLQLLAGGRAFFEPQLGREMGVAKTAAFINGSGAAGEPTGLLNVAGITTVSGSSLDWADVCTLLDAAEGYELDGMAFILGHTTAKLLRQREKAAGSGFILADGVIDNVPAYVTRAAPDDALMVFPAGRVVAAEWGALEVAITEKASAAAFATGQVSIRLMQSVDWFPEKPALVGASTSIT